MSHLPARGYPGHLVVLEGLDGAGTTSQATKLAIRLREAGHSVLVTREPSDGPVGVLLRQALTGRLGLPGHAGPLSEETLALLFAADRMDHLAAQVLPALHAGKVVLCDRYVLSSLAYQGAVLPLPWVEALNAHALPADVTFFLRVGLETAEGRRRRRGDATPERFEAPDSLRRVHASYEAVVKQHAEQQRVVVLDGEADMDIVTSRLWTLLSCYLTRGTLFPASPTPASAGKEQP